MTIPAERSFAVLVAIDRYSEAKKGVKPDLAAAKNDALAIKRMLIEPCGFAPENVRLLMDAEANKKSIEDALVELARKLRMQTGPARLWFQLSGHGLPAAQEDTYATMFATIDTENDDPSRTALSWERIVELLPKEIEELVVVLDICHAKNMPGVRLREETNKKMRRAVLLTAMNGQSAYELKDKSNSVFAKALIEAVGEGKVPLRAGELRFRDVVDYVQRRVPTIAKLEWGTEQTVEVTGNQSEDWVLATPCQPWPRPVPLPKVLIGFDTEVPPETPKDAPWQCLVVSASSDETAGRRLKDLAHDALKLCQKAVRQHGCTLDVDPVGIAAVEAFSSDDQLVQVLRALCRFPIAIFDVTDFEPMVMLLLGFRSVVRRGVTICSHGGNYRLGDDLEFPFNFREVSFAAHSQAQIDPAVPKLLRDRVLAGVREIKDRPGSYLDLPGFDAVRRVPAAIERAKPTIFVLCPFGKSYVEKTWPTLESALKDTFDADLEDEFEVVRMMHIASPRLVTQTLYEQIRRSSICVVDLSLWRPNVLLELGVRLAISPDGADCIIEGSSSTLSEPQRLLVERLKPVFYGQDGHGKERGLDPFHEIAQRHVQPSTVPTPWFSAISRWIDPLVEIPEVRPDEELRVAAWAVEPEESTMVGQSRLLYPSELLQRRASQAALDRRIGAWLYLDGCYELDQIAREKYLAAQYTQLAALVLQHEEHLRRDKPKLVARMRQQRELLENAKKGTSR
jgi:hypothetical protein